jgi:hypothetical protein
MGTIKQPAVVPDRTLTDETTQALFSEGDHLGAAFDAGHIDLAI